MAHWRGSQPASKGWIVSSTKPSPHSWQSLTPRNSASSITRDVSRIIRENIASREGAHHPTQGQDTHFHAQSQQNTNTSTNNLSPQTQTYIRVNILQQGKRTLPRLDILAGQCPDVETVKQAILRRYPNLNGSNSLEHHPQQARESPALWKVKAWLPQGLTPIQVDKDWNIALLTAYTTEWMDGDLKVLVEIDENTQV